MKYNDINPHRFRPGDVALAVNSSEDRAGLLVEVFTSRQLLKAIRESDRSEHYFIGYGVRRDGREFNIPECWLRPLDPLPDDTADDLADETQPRNREEKCNAD